MSIKNKINHFIFFTKVLILKREYSRTTKKEEYDQWGGGKRVEGSIDLVGKAEIEHRLIIKRKIKFEYISFEDK